MSNFDIIIIGSGPAGVSAAYPLIESGLKILMVDAASSEPPIPPSHPFLQARLQDEQQWQWMIGKDFHAVHELGAISPKLRVPTFSYVFKDFLSKNHIETQNFIAVGSLAQGGLSNAWGCGVARFSDAELSEYPFNPRLLDQSYKTIALRMGVSGQHKDAMADYFGLDEWAQPPSQMDDLHQHLYNQYTKCNKNSSSHSFRLGRSRIAVLTNYHKERNGCDLLGNCLWGCHRRALYSSSVEIPTLNRHDNFHYETNFVVEMITQQGNTWSISGKQNNQHKTFNARTIILAAGTLATTRLALNIIKMHEPVRLYTCPTAAFLLWIPKKISALRVRSFGLGQLSFALKLQNDFSGFGSTFGTTGLPISEFVHHLPLNRKNSIEILSGLLNSCIIGNFFLPGNLSLSTAKLTTNGSLIVNGEYHNETPMLMSEAKKNIRKNFRQIGAILLPKSFTVAKPGSDIHYAGTLPMRASPQRGETNAMGELFGAKNIFVVDGACLSTLPEKSHTMTIMANADRIARDLVKHLHLY